MHYYNEFDPKAAAWLAELMQQNLIPHGTIDTRSILDVRPSDLSGFTQCHFFAGIGGWPLALQLAGWPTDRPVWTGSCPCQPFSSAGKQAGEADERHLWPEFRRLIAECSPPAVFGEQVASSLGRQWLSGVRADLEALGYAVGSADLCAAGVGAPHIRQRLFWGGRRRVAHRQQGLEGHPGDVHDRREPGRERQDQIGSAAEGGGVGGLADTQHSVGREVSGHQQDVVDRGDAGRQETHGLSGARSEICDRGLADCCCSGFSERAGDGGVQQGAVGALPGETPVGGGNPGGLADSDGGDAGPGREKRSGEHGQLSQDRGPGDQRLGHADGTGLAPRESVTQSGTPGSGMPDKSGASGFWSAYDLIPCRDGKARRIEPGTFPLASGVPGRVGLLRGYGNAIVPQVAATFVASFEEARASLPAGC